MHLNLQCGTVARRWLKKLFTASIALCLLAIAGLSSAQLPQTLTFPGPAGAKVQIQNINYDPGLTISGALKGSGDLIFDMGGGNKFTGAQTPFAGIFADDSGTVALDKTGYTFGKDITWSNAFGSSVSAKIKAGFTILAKSTGAIVLTADAECTLPFKDANGVQSVLQCSQSTLVLNSAGFVFDTHAGITNSPKIAACGFGITMTTPELTIQAPAKPAMKLKANNVTVATPIPSLLSDGTLAIAAQNFSIDETGLPSFDSMTLGSVASIDTAAAAEATNNKITLLQPANFGFELQDIGGSVTKGKLNLTKLDGFLVFPDDVKDEDHAGQEAKIPIAFDLAGRQFKSSASKALNLVWQPITSGPTLHLGIKNFTLDLAKGLTNLDASLRISGASQLGGDVSVDAAGAVFDGSGVSGKFTVKPSGIDIAGVHCTSGAINLDRDEIVGGAFVGSVHAGSIGDLGVAFGISSTGVNIAVQAAKGLNWQGFGKLNITQGGGSYDKSGKLTFTISGDVTLAAFPDADLGFDDLSFGTDGHIGVAKLSLTKPVEIDLGFVKLHADKMSYSDQPQQFVIDGDIKFPDSLPVTGQVGFEGLTVTPDGKFSVGGISFLAKIEGLGSLGGALKAGNTSYPQLGFNHVKDGELQLSLDVLGGAGITAQFFMADDGVWVAKAVVDLPPPGIPIPPAPATPVMSIYGGGVAVGHNVGLLPPNQQKQGGPWFGIYQKQPDNWLIAGMLDVSTLDMFVAWGRLTVALTLPQFSLSLNGKIALMTPRGNPDTDISDDRRGDITIGWFGNEFDMFGALNFQIPLMSMTGKFDAKFSPTQGYIHAGWPIEENGFTSTTGLPGVLAHSTRVGFNANFYPPPMRFEAALEESVNLLVLEGHRSVDVGFELGWEDSALHLGVGAGGTIDFIIAKLTASASAAGDMQFHHFVPVHASLGGDFTASLSTFLGDISVHAHEPNLIGW